MLNHKTKTKAVISLLIAVFMSLSFMSGCGNANAGKNDKKDTKHGNVSQLTDVNESDWFYDDVKSVCEKGLMNGTDAETFSPYEATTRAMIVTILWRLEGEPSAKKNSFTDVKKDAWYTDAVSWASKNNIVNGYNKKSFGPDDVATREQFAAIIYRYASLKNYDMNGDADIEKYADVGQISEYAIEAMKWANAKGIITGTSETTLSPKENVERCQVAAILRRLCELIESVEGNLSQNDNESAPEGTSSQNENGSGTEGNVSQDDNGLVAKGTLSQNGNGSGIESTPSQNKNGSSAEGTSSQNGNGSGTEDTSSQNSNGSGTGDNVEGGAAAENPSSDNKTENNQDTDESVTTPTIIVENVSAKPGDDVDVKIRIKKNPGILGMVLNTYFDDSSCVLKSVENGDAVKDILTLTPSKSLENGVRFVWDGVEISSEEVKDGSVLVMKYHISEKAKAGRYPITIKSFDGDIVDNNLNSLPVQIKSGSITVN